MIKIYLCYFITVLFFSKVYPQGIKYETEPNDTTNTANSIVYGDTIIASISPAGDVDFYKFNVSNVDTVIIFASPINNSQLSFTQTLTGNIISWDYYGDSIYVILGNGICYLRFSSSNNLMFAKNDFNKIPNYKSFPDNKINVKSNSQLIDNNQIKTSIISESNSLSDTGSYQVILKKFTHGVSILEPPGSPIDIYSSYTLDELWNSIRFRIYFFPNGSNTTVKWEYGTDLNYGHVKEYPDIFTGIKEYCAISYVSDLIPNTTYHFRIHLSNSYGDTFSNDYTFTTPEMPTNIEIIKPRTFINFTDTSFVASAGGGWYYILVPIDLENIAFKDNLNGWNIVGSKNKFLCTNDGGITWSQKDSPVRSYYGNLSFIDLLNGFLVSLSDSLFIFNTSDGGNSWNQRDAIYIHCGYAISEIEVQIINSSFSDLMHGTVVGSVGTETDCNNWNYLLLHTTNGGITWLQQNGSLGEHNSFSDVTFIDSLNGFVVGANFGDGGGMILNTTDGGVNWEIQNYLVNVYLLGVSFSDISHGTIIGYDFDKSRGIILHTTNGGNTWQLQDDNLNNYNPVYTDISFLDSLNGIIIGKDGLIIQTSDGGSTWNQRVSGTNNDLFCITFLKNNQFYISGEWETILTGDIVTSVNEFQNVNPTKFELFQNYPNPFNPTSTIKYAIPKASLVTIKIYDILGNEIATLVNEEKSAGSFEVEFDASNFSSGIYFYQMQAGNFTETKKLILIR